ncbi:FkbM family methyltransferase [Mesobacillus subterraneus]|uniref:FkbM family methyltransferase n=1 Tax=Mesobacillus subterraneus TaxID=285983 RepID=UPI00203D4A6F|nr:FkbM family methyltransferase [Mesobacillus subterraneus]MCM3574109.1 FkbM family methyltransferase [Mesobacillus subterraneus]
MFGNYIGNNKMLIKAAYNGMLTISSNDLSIMPSLVTNGFIEMPLTNYFIKRVKSGQTVVDIGANVGYYTVLAGMLVGAEGKVFGYEANPKTFSFLQDNIQMNWLTQQTKIENKAIYSKNTTLEFNISSKFQGDSSIKCSSDPSQIKWYNKVSVDATTLDNELKNIDKIDLLKIDIEGGEFHAFHGMLELIGHKKIKNIIFEWNKGMLGKDAELFAELLRDILNQNDGLIYTLTQEGEILPATLDIIISNDFYPFALIEFI